MSLTFQRKGFFQPKNLLGFDIKIESIKRTLNFSFEQRWAQFKAGERDSFFYSDTFPDFLCTVSCAEPAELAELAEPAEPAEPPELHPCGNTIRRT